MDENFAQIGFLLTVITVIILLLVLLLVNLMLTSRNRKLMHQAEMQQAQSMFRENIAAIRMEVAEATLSDVSRDLHDEVGQLLTFGVLQMENLQNAPEHEKQQMIGEVKQSIRDALDSIRSISRGLSPDIVNQQGLIISLEQLFERAAFRTGRKFRLDVEHGFSVNNPSYSIIVFRIIRECVTNAIRHGLAKEVVAHLKQDDQFAHISIIDNGIGISAESIQDGLGFKSMQHYAQLMAGKLKIENLDGSGTRIILTFPNISV